MALARSYERWRHTSELLAMIANTIPREDGEPLLWTDFHPHTQGQEFQRRDEVQGDSIEYLEGIGF